MRGSRIRLWVPAVGLAVALSLAGCARMSLAPRYLSRCPAEGPEVSADLGLRVLPIDLDRLYADIHARVRARGGALELRELGSVRDAASQHPILAIRQRGAAARHKLLIVAGIHGNETAGLLAVPAILDLLATDRDDVRLADVTLVAPANPVGVAHGSRYNANGCDLNRDFRDPQNWESRWLRDLILEEPPDLVVALHEGAQDGYLLVVTSRGSARLGEAAVRAVQRRGIALASTHFTGLSLGTPGLSAEAGGTDFLKWLVRLHTLGRFANGLGIGTYTAETSWSSEDAESRVAAHVATIEGLLAALAGP